MQKQILLVVAIVLLFHFGEGLKCWECDADPNARSLAACFSDHRGKSVECEGYYAYCAININVHNEGGPTMIWKFCKKDYWKPALQCEEIVNFGNVFMETCYCRNGDNCNKYGIDGKGIIYKGNPLSL